MSNTTTIIPNRIVFNKQIPVPNVDARLFKEAIQDKEIKCSINGARVNNPHTKSVNVDVSFKVLDHVKVLNPGTSINGRTLKVDGMKPMEDKKDVMYLNVTLNFDVLKHEEKEIIEINNTHEFYSILSHVLKDKELMEAEETGSIKIFYKNLNSFVRGGLVYLTSKNVISDRGYSRLEVYAVKGETQNEKMSN